MKRLQGDQQLRSVSLSYSVAFQALKPKSSPRRRRGLDASTDRGLTERVEKCFCLTSSLIGLSEMAIFYQLKLGLLSVPDAELQTPVQTLLGLRSRKSSNHSRPSTIRPSSSQAAAKTCEQGGRIRGHESRNRS